MGPEALDRSFALAAFRQRLARYRRAPINAALLNQETVAGIGNIYADECLHLARIHPRRPIASLTPAELRRLHRAIRVILSDAVNHSGTSFPHFLDTGHHRETWLDHTRLFDREGTPCPACGSLVQRTRVAGRGTNFCPHCQPIPPTARPHLKQVRTGTSRQPRPTRAREQRIPDSTTRDDATPVGNDTVK